MNVPDPKYFYAYFWLSNLKSWTLDPGRTALELPLSNQSTFGSRTSSKYPVSSRKFFWTALAQMNLTDVSYIAFFMITTSTFPQNIYCALLKCSVCATPLPASTHVTLDSLPPSLGTTPHVLASLQGNHVPF